jgi:hypothetical protein
MEMCGLITMLEEWVWGIAQGRVPRSFTLFQKFDSSKMAMAAATTAAAAAVFASFVSV